MKKYFYKGSAFVGILASSLAIHAQSAGVGSVSPGAGAAPGAGAVGTGVSPASPARPAVTAPTVGATGADTGVRAGGGVLITPGAAGINQPAASAPIGGASAVSLPPDTAVGAASITQQNPGGPAAAGTIGTLPGGALSSDRSAQQGITSSIIGNSVANPALVVDPLANAQAGISLTTLPPNLQQSIQTRLGGAQVQTISRDDLANGSVYRVTTLQNGVPTEMRFGSNGNFLGTTPLSGSSTSSVKPETAVVLDTLPTAIQTTIRSQVGNGQVGRIVPQGQGYVVTYDLNGQTTTMVVGPDGRVVRAGPTAVGAPPQNTLGTGGQPEVAPQPASPQPSTNGTRTSSVKIEDLPEPVRTALKNEAGDANIQFINREQRAAGEVYLVGARSENDYLQLTIDGNGRVIRDTRDTPIVTSAEPVPAPVSLDSGIPLTQVPLAIRDAVKAYTSVSEIRSVNLETDKGKTVYAVVFMQDGRRDRMIVAKDGSVLRTERNVSAELDNSKSAPQLAIGDLPRPVQDTVNRHTDKVLVQEITTKKLGDEQIYSIRYEANGKPVELLVDASGTAVIPQAAEDAGGPQSAPVSNDENVRIVSETPTTTDSAGAAPARETSTSRDSRDNE